MGRIGRGRATVLGAGILGLAATGMAHAQMPPEAAEIGRCVCMDREVQRLSADMAAKMAALDRLNQRVAALTERLRQERGTLDVNDPAAVERFKALLEERDAVWKRSVGAVWRAADDAVRRYDAVVREYNGSCAHRLFDSVLLRQLQATATCAAPGYGPPPGPTESEYPPPPGYGPPPPRSEFPPAPPPPPEPGYPPAPPPPR